MAGPAQIHLFVVGWLTQLIFGIAYWMFPKATAQQPRGNDALAVLTYVCLNLGLLARVIGEPWQAVAPGVMAGGLLVASGVLQWLGGVGFAVLAWPRVRGRARHREGARRDCGHPPPAGAHSAMGKEPGPTA